METYISLAHGDGGELSHRLIRDIFVSAFGDKNAVMFDAAAITMATHKIAVTTDSFVIKPIFFPGGSIGKLAVAGTVNDLAVSGAKPAYLTCGFVIEEGFPISNLKKIVTDMANEAKKSGVTIVAGDTKVVERGSADGVYINTTGIGVYQPEIGCSLEFAEGDAVIVSGTIGDHGIAVLTARGELGITAPVNSDCASLNNMLEAILKDTSGIKIMRDPTRGGLATTLVEIAEDFQLTINIQETAIPVKAEVHGVCDLLGYDPLYLANEGKAIIIVSAKEKDKVVEILRKFPEGKDAAIIGSISSKEKGRLLLETPLGAKRLLTRLSGTMFPRIC
ncbi:hydrogenase expression/formation protein HypE [Neobacillus sp. OS1-32]|jgi:hydrogenase expression/formation protein HypE|uniref:Hydrogenase expression/formation protein HypE n=1 Tax=Neobacillus paridis TaxID=2803862 RepID=A0ABS1TRB4_9BACI|nr:MULTISPECIES: hydrogenase expression/formation protein HypE [Neobacillus]MBL4953855.1 hydrogenase expression/formation protein HypE [Neobacillus paridis]WML30969.1 hydrogenase expression/formation protein HypE [Neobacillus sp. OS1-32]